MNQPQKKVWRMTGKPGTGLSEIGTHISGPKVNTVKTQIVLAGSRRRSAPSGPVVTPEHVKVTVCPSPTYDARYELPPGSEIKGPFTQYPPGINPDTGRPW